MASGKLPGHLFFNLPLAQGRHGGKPSEGEPTDSERFEDNGQATISISSHILFFILLFLLHNTVTDEAAAVPNSSRSDSLA